MGIEDGITPSNHGFHRKHLEHQGEKQLNTVLLLYAEKLAIAVASEVNRKDMVRYGLDGVDG